MQNRAPFLKLIWMLGIFAVWQTKHCQAQSDFIRVVGNGSFLPYEPVLFQVEVLGNYFKENNIDLIKKDKSNEAGFVHDIMPGDPPKGKHQTKIEIYDGVTKIHELTIDRCQEANGPNGQIELVDRSIAYFIDLHFSTEDQEKYWSKPGLRRIEVSYSYDNVKTITCSHHIKIEEPSETERKFLEAWPKKNRNMLSVLYLIDFWDKAVSELAWTKDVVESRKEYELMYELCKNHRNTKYAQMMIGNLLLISYSKYAERKSWQQEKILDHYDLTIFELQDTEANRVLIERAPAGYLYGLAMNDFHKNTIRSAYYFENAFKNDKTLTRYMLWGGKWNNIKGKLNGM